MAAPRISGGTAHKLPADMRAALVASPSALKAWESLTPLARNEWICWTTLVKKQETRDEHVKRLISELKEGKRRPCCWMGCTHRTDKPLNATQKWMRDKQRAKAGR